MKREQEARKASEFQQIEARRAQESQAKIQKTNAELGQIGAKTALTKAQTADIAEQQAINRKNQQLRESIAKTDEQIANAKNDIERQKLQVQKDRMEKQINTNQGKLETKQKFNEQKEINKNNKTFNDTLNKQIGTIPKLKPLIKEARELITGKKSGARLSGYIPQGLASKGSQRLNTIANEIVRILGENARTDTERENIANAKLSLKHGRPAQLAAINDLDNGIKLLEQQDKIRRRVIKENGGNQPANLASLINEQLQSEPEYAELQQSAAKGLAKDQMLEQPIGATFQGPNGQFYTRVKYGSGIKPATSEEIAKVQNG